MRGIDVIGSDSGGLFSTLFQAGSGIVDYVKKDQQEGDTAKDADQKLQAALAADSAATTARWRALVSADAAARNPSQLTTAKADQMAAESAGKMQDVAGAAVPDSKKQARIDVATKAVTAAQKAYDGAPTAGKPAAALLLQAAQETLTKAQGGSVDYSSSSASAAEKGKGGDTKGSSFFGHALVGPVKVWHAVGAAVVTVGGVLLYRWKSK